MRQFSTRNRSFGFPKMIYISDATVWKFEIWLDFRFFQNGFIIYFLVEIAKTDLKKTFGHTKQNTN